jgi:hypothetical protein
MRHILYPGGGKHAPTQLFDERVGEPGARTPTPTTNPTWREVTVMVLLAALLVLAIFAVYPGPPPSPTVNIPTAVRASTDHRMHARELKRRAEATVAWRRLERHLQCLQRLQHAC